MIRMHPLRTAALLLALLPAVGWSQALSLADARRALSAPAAETRLAGVERLGEIGTMADADRLVARLADDDDDVREHAGSAMWLIWSRSGMYGLGIRSSRFPTTTLLPPTGSVRGDLLGFDVKYTVSVATVGVTHAPVGATHTRVSGR